MPVLLEYIDRFLKISTNVTGFAKRGLRRAIQYNYLENDWSYLHVFLHKPIAIQSNSLYLMYTG